jgi:hypothetical protein
MKGKSDPGSIRYRRQSGWIEAPVIPAKAGIQSVDAAFQRLAE